MTQTRSDERTCQASAARLDGYIDTKLRTEEHSLDLMEHFPGCTACTREAQERRNVDGEVRGRCARIWSFLLDPKERVRDRLGKRGNHSRRDFT